MRWTLTSYSLLAVFCLAVTGNPLRAQFNGVQVNVDQFGMTYRWGRRQRAIHRRRSQQSQQHRDRLASVRHDSFELPSSGGGL